MKYIYRKSLSFQPRNNCGANFDWGSTFLINWILRSGRSMTMLAILSTLLITGCNRDMIDRLEWVGKEPPIKKIENPHDKSAPVKWPSANIVSVKNSNPNSLWDRDSREFFRDQRARRVGDILTVKIAISDKAELDNKTERTRTSSDSLGVPSVFGLEKQLTGMLPGKANPASLLSVNGNMDNSGEGIIEREEIIEIDIAAVVTQVMPNGNLVIYGSQEIRVNYETRQVTVEGVIRTSDISPENIISSHQIAEARISYGGKGLISDVQQPRIGNQIADILSPW